MATAYDYDEVPDNDAPAQSERDLRDIHAEALQRFDDASEGQLEIRAHALTCRRFISVPGAMWEGPWGDQFENSIKVEIDKLSKGVDKIVQDYRDNRIVPDFRPGDDEAVQDTADTLDGIHRADSHAFSAQQARDNAFEEAASGGFGAYRLANVYADPYDKDSDEQRINPGLTIVDADQRVFFDPNAKLYDKSDARYAFVLTAVARKAFEKEYPDAAIDWQSPQLHFNYDWFTNDVVIKAEYYVVDERPEKLHVFKHPLGTQEQRWWDSEIEPAEIEELRSAGWQQETRKRVRCRVRKYVMNGAQVLDDCGYIAGTCIPIVPVYGKRWFVDNVERFRGFVSKRMDAARIYNAKVSKLTEIDSLSPREKPIFAASQMPPKLQRLWAEQDHERYNYALVEPLLDPATGQIVSAGPIGKVEPPQLQPVTALLLQIAKADLEEESEDDAQKIVSNTSAEAMDIAATRIDAKSGIYLDNMRQSVQREGEIYLSMCGEVYFEPGRVLETMTGDDGYGTAKLHEPYVTSTGAFGIRNDFAKGKYKVIVEVTEATATRKEKTVKSSLATAQIAMAAQDVELAQASVITAVMNQEGEGMDDLRRFARRRALALGLVEPNDEEKAAMAQQAQAAAQQPDPQAQYLSAKSDEAHASALLKMAQATAVGGPDAAPKVPSGLEAAHKLADVNKKVAEARKIDVEAAHLPERLAIERTNAATKRAQVEHQGIIARARNFLGSKGYRE